MSSWMQASRLPSQTYIAFPILFGQMIAYLLTGTWSWLGFALAQLFGLFDQLYIVYANDFADAEIDGKNETFNMFSGGSRVLVEGKISKTALGRAAVLMAALSLIVSGTISYLSASIVPTVLVAIGLLLLWGYSYAPFRLSYRGGGEFLQMLGVGGILPLVGYIAQTGSLAGFPWIVLAITLPISLACGIGTSIPDQPSDKVSDKRTASVILGPVRVQMVVVLFAAVSLILWVVLGVPMFPDILPRLLAVVIPFALLVAGIAKMGSKPGTKKLDSFVTFMVASNVTFFLSMSILLAIS